MKYDQADWHSEGEFPDDLAAEHGATHIGMFLAWIIHRGLQGKRHDKKAADGLAAVRARTMSGREFLLGVCGGKLTDKDLDETGNAFAAAYYESEDEAWAYAFDYEATLAGGLPTPYHVADTWENFDRLAPVLDRRFEEWQQRAGG